MSDISKEVEYQKKKKIADDWDKPLSMPVAVPKVAKKKKPKWGKKE